MIFDRTQNDVVGAKKLIEEKVKHFIPLSEQEVEKLERGTLTINTLNRIENKQKDLKTAINSMGYYNTPITNKEWSYVDIFYSGDFERILNNINYLRHSFFTYNDTPITPNNKYTNYQVINDVENILYDIGEMINDVKSLYVECGEVECGEV